MSFFIWWGTNTESISRGVVVDTCWSCGALQCFLIADHFTISHVYSINIGRGSWAGTTRVCCGCGQHFEFYPQRYAVVLSMHAAATLSLESGLARCIPSLAESHALVQTLQAASAQAAYRGNPAAEGALAQAAKTLDTLVRYGYDAGKTAPRLRAWQSLAPEELREVVAELRGIAQGVGIEVGAA